MVIAIQTSQNNPTTLALSKFIHAVRTNISHYTKAKRNLHLDAAIDKNDNINNIDNTNCIVARRSRRYKKQLRTVEFFFSYTDLRVYTLQIKV